MTGKKGMTEYPLEVKLEAMRLFYDEGKTRKAITDMLGIRDPDRVKAWLKRYRREGAEGFSKVRRGRPPKRENTAAYIARLEMEVELLKKFHTELRKQELAKRNIGSSIDKEAHTK
jgi:transposase-like protein